MAQSGVLRYLRHWDCNSTHLRLHSQVLENYRRRSVDGLAWPFLLNWLLGEASTLTASHHGLTTGPMTRGHVKSHRLYSDASAALPGACLIKCLIQRPSLIGFSSDLPRNILLLR